MKTRNTLIVGLMALLVAGCTNSVSFEHIQWASEMCEENGGVDRISRTGWMAPSAYCKNGATFYSENGQFSGY